MNIVEMQVNGHPFKCRECSSDDLILSKMLTKDPAQREYIFPPMKAKVIFDIGANIGVTALDLHEHYPEAEIYAFEPCRSNFELLSFNTAWCPQIKVFNIGLWCADGEGELFYSDMANNFGGASLHTAGTRNESEKVKLVDIRSFIAEHGISHVDVVKIDCEGAEKEILFAMPTEIIETVQWMEGELHGNGDYRLLDYLSQYFHLAFKKAMEHRCWNFQARRK